MKACYTFGVLILFLSIVSGCSGKPDSSYIENEVKKVFGSVSLDKVTELKKFTKINGFEKDQNTYIVEVSYDILLKVSARDFFAKLKELDAPNKMVRPMLPMYMVAEQVTSAIFGENFKAGELRNVAQKLTLIKTDNGWMVSEFKDVDAFYDVLHKSSISPVN